MVICPKCKKEIDSLNNFQSGEAHYHLWINGNSPHYEEKEFQPDNKVNDYECPECSEVLFTDEDKAIAFLKGGDELQSIVEEKIKLIKMKGGKK